MKVESAQIVATNRQNIVRGVISGCIGAILGIGLWALLNCHSLAGISSLANHAVLGALSIGSAVIGYAATRTLFDKEPVFDALAITLLTTDKTNQLAYETHENNKVLYVVRNKEDDAPKEAFRIGLIDDSVSVEVLQSLQNIKTSSNGNFTTLSFPQGDQSDAKQIMVHPGNWYPRIEKGV
jgi:hypothetical protein